MKYILSVMILMFSGAIQAETFYVPKDAPPDVAAVDVVQKAHELADLLHGKVAHVAATGSMNPTITAGDLLVYKPAKMVEISKGDIVIVSYLVDDKQHNPSLIAHRVINKASNGEFWTKGDANRDVDKWANSDMNLKAVVVYIIDAHTGEIRYERK